MILQLWTTTAIGQYREGKLPVVPIPVSVEMGSGEFNLRQDCSILSDSEFREEAEMLAILLSPSQPVSVGDAHESAYPDLSEYILFRFDSDIEHDEGYRLEIDSVCIVITAKSPPGAYYAVQTLRQLLPASVEAGAGPRTVRLPAMHIIDYPRFSWRGGMLDCSRHFMSIPFIKRFIRNLASLKMNRFHWHLTDDQGWRIEILRYPLLTTVGAYRDRGGIVYGGYYSQQEIRDIVDYAARHHVIVVPEIEMPGHSTAAQAAYPTLNCQQLSIPVSTKWGIHDNVICAGREATYSFLKEVLTEVAGLFPSPWIHIGGDETPTDQWQAHDRCQDQILASGLLNVGGLQSYFTERVIGILDSLGKTGIGWNEILRGGVSEKVIVQAWHGIEAGNEAARLGHAVIMSPNTHTYLDYEYYAISVRKAHEFDPLPAGVPDSLHAKFLGMEGNLWSESSPTEDIAESKIYPRIAALAEDAWSPHERKDWDDFRIRLAVLGGRWTRANQIYHPDSSVSWDDGRSMSAVVSPVSVSDLQKKWGAEKMSGTVSVLCSHEINMLHSDHIVSMQIYEDEQEEMLDTWLFPAGLTLKLNNLRRGNAAELSVRGINKKTNPWAEITDVTSADGLLRKRLTWSVQEKDAFRIFPNPIHSGTMNRAYIFLTLDTSTGITFRIWDRLGRIVQSRSGPGAGPGGHHLRMDVSALPTGVYFVEIVVDGESSFAPFQIIQ